MADNYPIPENPVFNPEIRKLLDSDPASASTVFNPLVERLLENILALKNLLDGKVGTAQMQEVVNSINTTLSNINTALNGKAPSTHGHNAATNAAAGFMSAADKSKLDGITAKATANNASTTTPKALGAASAGSESGYARGDHVHPKPSAADIGAAAANHGHTAAQVGALATNGTAATSNNLTSTGMSNTLNRTNKVSDANTAYTTYMARAIAITSSTPSSMTNGTICGVY